MENTNQKSDFSPFRNASTAEAKAEIKAKTGETPNIAPPVASAVKSQEQSK